MAVSALQISAAQDQYPFGQAETSLMSGPLPSFTDLLSHVSVEPCPNVHHLRRLPHRYTFNTCVQVFPPPLVSLSPASASCSP